MRKNNFESASATTVIEKPALSEKETANVDYEQVRELNKRQKVRKHKRLLAYNFNKQEQEGISRGIKKVMSVMKMEKLHPGIIESSMLDLQKTSSEVAKLYDIPDSINKHLSKRFLLEKPIGSGAMGVVFKAYDMNLQQDAVVKFFSPKSDTSYEEMLKRFELEAESLAQISDPRVVRVYDHAAAHDGAFIAMELVKGTDLNDEMERLENKKAIPVKEGLSILQKAAEAIGVVHKAKVAHRDIKPANFFWDPENKQVKIGDFGLAKQLFKPKEPVIKQDEHGRLVLSMEDPTLTRAGSIMGTPRYMSPEQAKGGEITTASDVYSFGKMMYRILYGKDAHTSDDVYRLIVMVAQDEPIRYDQNRKLPSNIVNLMKLCLQYESADRPTITQVDDSLKTILKKYVGEKSFNKQVNKIVENAFSDGDKKQYLTKVELRQQKERAKIARRNLNMRMMEKDHEREQRELMKTGSYQKEKPRIMPREKNKKKGIFSRIGGRISGWFSRK